MPYIKIKALYNFEGKIGEIQSVRKAKGKQVFKIKIINLCNTKKEFAPNRETT